MHVQNFVKQIIRRAPFYQRLRRAIELRRFRLELQKHDPLNVILGAGTTSFQGWIATDSHVLDIASARDWSRIFKKESIDRLVCEHVLEHLNEAQCSIALSQCYRYLKPGGLLRIAVPDGYRRDPAYVEEVTPPKDGHQMLFTIDTLVPLLENHGFSVKQLEYFDAQEKFHSNPWDETDGFIRRSIRFDDQTAFQRNGMFYTSLIVDAKKV